MPARAGVVAVILNWNGGEDTVACLESLVRQTFRPSLTVVVDNGSEDDSLALITAWSDRQGATIAALDPALALTGGHESDVPLGDAAESMVIIASPDNLGFAAGSNLGIRYAMKARAEYVLLLNNDTVVEPEALEHLVAFMTSHPDYAACTGQIRYQGRPVIWNCGGDLTWFGSRRYLFSEEPVSATPQSGWRRITFITGCAALVRTTAFAEQGLLTERFFFGEEDYEFSRRLKRKGLPIACTFDAVIHHKVGSSIDRAAPPAQLGRYYIYYLNRFIDMRDYYPKPIWWSWRWLSLAMVLPRLKRSRRLSSRGLWLLARRLLLDSARLDGVSRERFEIATRSGLEAL
jgi:GT2 family glycosyltransferase